jgi:hypothetical protein
MVDQILFRGDFSLPGLNIPIAAAAGEKDGKSMNGKDFLSHQ